MPLISMLRGMTVYMHFMDNRYLELPHLRARCRDDEAVVSISEGKVLEGNFPEEKTRFLQDWIELHREELMNNWEMITSGRHPYKIEPLDGSHVEYSIGAASER